MPAPRMLTKKIDKETFANVTASWIDTSFDHEFGRKEQGHYEVTAVVVNGVNMPLDILDSKFLEEMDDYVNT